MYKAFIVGFCSFALAACSLASSGVAQTSGSQPTTEELFKKEIAPHQWVIVTREPFDVRSLGDLGAALSQQKAGVACVRVKLQVNDAVPVLLGATIQDDFPDFRHGFYVLDVFRGNNELIVGCAIRDKVALWRIRLDLQYHLPDGWTWVGSPVPYEAIIPFARDKVTIDMVQLVDGRWSLTLTDKRPPHPVTGHYEQAEQQWMFKRAPE